MPYCMYLRKSRADIEAEAKGEEETLARHERILTSLAQKMNIYIPPEAIYREVISGETIASRPIMQHVLSEVEQKIWDGVFVVEVERLARGDTIDQGIVAQTFKYSGTKIITPIKIYDPNNEYDEEYFEFGLFMSRREYKTTTRRLQRGRHQSFLEGKYTGNIPPYGYQRKRLENQKGFTLEPHPEESKVVKLIFDWYVGPDQLGISQIRNKLNKMQIPTRKGGDWTTHTIRNILSNPVYTGNLRSGERPQVKEVVNGEVIKKRPRRNDPKTVKGLHPAIVDESIFRAAQSRISNGSTAPVPGQRTLKNPLAGLVVCGICGRKLIRRPYQYNSYPDTLMCPGPTCHNVSSQLHLVEDRLLQVLALWLQNYKLDIQTHKRQEPNLEIDLLEKSIENIDKEIKTLQTQLDNLHDLLEQKVYSADTFFLRSRVITEKLDNAKNQKKQLVDSLQNVSKKEKSKQVIIPKVEKAVDLYWHLSTPKEKNDLLKEILDKVVYTKKTKGHKLGTLDGFELALYPKIPR